MLPGSGRRFGDDPLYDSEDGESPESVELSDGLEGDSSGDETGGYDGEGDTDSANNGGDDGAVGGAGGDRASIESPGGESV